MRGRKLALERLAFDPIVCFGNAFSSECVRGRMLAMERGHFALVQSIVNIVRRNGAQPIDARPQSWYDDGVERLRLANRSPPQNRQNKTMHASGNAPCEVERPLPAA